MMKRLQEIRSLVDLARKFGQEPAAELLQQLQQLEMSEQRRLDREAQIRERIAADITEMFAPVMAPVIADIGSTSAITVMTEALAEPLLEVQVPPNSVDVVRDYIARNVKESIVAPEPVLAQPQKDLEREIKYLREWVSRIAATGPGGGAAEIYNLDMPTTTVTGDYVIKRKDYYIGVSSAVKTYITLPTTGVNLKNGRVVIIKDESGHAQLTPIAIVGTIDNDPNGAEIRVNNGTVQLIYRDGWRII
jgi:hypothetical protein